MKARDAAVVACRGLAVYAVITSLNTLSYALPSVFTFFGLLGRGEMFSANTLTAGLATLGYAATPVLVGVAASVLWRKAGAIAARMLPAAHDEEDAAPLSGEQAATVQAVVFAAFGAFILVTSVPRLVGHIFATVLSAWETDTSVSEALASGFSLVDTALFVVKFLLALLLLFGARGLVRIIAWLRVVGRPRAADAAKREDTP